MAVILINAYAFDGETSHLYTKILVKRWIEHCGHLTDGQPLDLVVNDKLTLSYSSNKLWFGVCGLGFIQN